MDQWKFVRELPGAQVATVKGKRIAFFGEDKNHPEPEEVLQVWERQNGDWPQDPSFVQNVQDVCALAFDDSDNLFVLQNTGELTIFAISNTQDPQQTGSLTLFEDPAIGNPPCSLAIMKDADDPEYTSWLAASIGGDYTFGWMQEGEFNAMAESPLVQPVQSLTFLSSQYLLIYQTKILWQNLDKEKSTQPQENVDLPGHLLAVDVEDIHFELDGKLLVILTRQNGVTFWFTAPNGLE